MSRKNVIILIIISIIIGIISYTYLQENTQIKKVIFTENKSISDKEIENYNQNAIPTFKPNSQIYAVILVKNIRNKDNINIEWFIKKDNLDNNQDIKNISKSNANNNLNVESNTNLSIAGIPEGNLILIQQNKIEINQDGSGKIIVSLVKKDASNQKGDYIVNITLNKNPAVTFSFKIQ